MTFALNNAGTATAFPLRSVTGVEAVAVKLRTRFQTLRGEWLADTDFGTPMLEWQPGASNQEIESWYRAQARQVDGVKTVISMDVTRSGEDVSVRGVFAVETAEDGLVTLTVGEPLPYDTRGAPAWYTVSGALRGRALWHRV